MLTRTQAGLFSAVTSAFILDVQSRLRPDAGDETVALLRVLIYKIDNTTFGNNTPTLPQWTGPPHAIVQVQSMLYASLTAALLSAFLAMLGKQWLNRYASTDMRGTAVERSQNRQRKLDGIIAWYFDHVMQSLPLMLQIALLLLGCALSRYLLEINTTVASVVLGVTSFGLIFYLFIVVAGTASETCPYQTPGSHTLRYLVHSAPSIIASAFRNVSRESKAVRTISVNVRYYRPWWSRRKIMPFLMDMVREFPCALVTDIYHLARAMIRPLAAFIHQVYGTSSAPELGSDHQTTVLDLRCISWMLQISLDKIIRLSALKHLMAVAVLPDFDPTLVADCFSLFIGCINVRDRKVVIMHELEELATAAAMCFLRTFHHLSVMDPTSSVLVDLRRRHIGIFPFVPEFGSLPFYSTMARIHDLVRDVQWGNHRPSTPGYIPAARDMAEAARVGYRKGQRREVPSWTLHFAFRSLSLHPPPPSPVIADCLSIIAIDLGCDVSNIGSTTSDERYVRISPATMILTPNQCTSGGSFEPDNAKSQNDD